MFTYFVTLSFPEEQIDKEAFLAITEGLARDLIARVGLRAKFLAKLAEYKVCSSILVRF